MVAANIIKIVVFAALIIISMKSPYNYEKLKMFEKSMKRLHSLICLPIK